MQSLIFAVVLFFPNVQIRILCGVEHDDLKNLCLVSKSIKEAVSELDCIYLCIVMILILGFF